MNTVQELMNAIKHFDSEPPVFKVHLIAADHFEGFRTVVEFRSTVNGAVACFDTSADTPEESLQAAYNNLAEKWGPCPHCGEYRHG